MLDRLREAIMRVISERSDALQREANRESNALQNKIRDLTQGLHDLATAQDTTNATVRSRVDRLNLWMLVLTIAGVLFALGSLMIDFLAWQFPKPSGAPQAVIQSPSVLQLTTGSKTAQGVPKPSPVHPDAGSSPVPPPVDSTSKAGTPPPAIRPATPAPPPQEPPKPDA